jgi:hypothetical protein
MLLPKVTATVKVLTDDEVSAPIGDRFRSEEEGAAYLKWALPRMTRSEIRMARQFDYKHPYQRKIINDYVRAQGWTKDDDGRDDRPGWKRKFS